jgi:hypothetical protein
VEDAAAADFQWSADRGLHKCFCPLFVRAYANKEDCQVCVPETPRSASCLLLLLTPYPAYLVLGQNMHRFLGAHTHLKQRRMTARNSLDSHSANWLPMHARMPKPHGLYAAQHSTTQDSGTQRDTQQHTTRQFTKCSSM